MWELRNWLLASNSNFLILLSSQRDSQGQIWIPSSCKDVGITDLECESVESDISGKTENCRSAKKKK